MDQFSARMRFGVAINEIIGARMKKNRQGLSSRKPTCASSVGFEAVAAAMVADRLPAHELSVHVGHGVTWEGLPADPRRPNLKIANAKDEPDQNRCDAPRSNARAQRLGRSVSRIVIDVGYEIDFLPVGKSGPGGDAIALRIGDLEGSREDQFVAIIDGGFTSNGVELVQHVTTVYDTNRVDVVLSTHLDADHIVGLNVVIEELEVGELWMHEPTSTLAAELTSALAHDGGNKERLTAITASVQQSKDLATRARELGIEIVAPHTGRSAMDGSFRVLGPTQAYYDELVPRFRLPRPAMSLQAAMGLRLQETGSTLHREDLYEEALDDTSNTDAENNSSVITLVEFEDHVTILTGDAGEDALNRAADYLDESGFDWSKLRAIQVPHHGSRNNVTPAVLTRFLGEKGQEERNKMAFVSCSIDGGVHHPAKQVTNAFRRRGCKVYKTAGGITRHSHSAPKRTGFKPAEEVEFYDEVD